MPVSPADARSTLHDIGRTDRASKTLYGYRMTAPHLILWGVVWVVGYGATQFFPRQNLVWPVLDLLGCLGSFYVGVRSSRNGAETGAGPFAATVLAIVLFLGALFAILPPLNGRQVGALFPILVALFYALLGIWNHGMRLIVAAAAVAGLTLGGYFWLPQFFALWMAVVGGGGLILGGVWLRRA